VASAGNLGQEVVVYPGGFRNVLGVASTNSANPPVRSSFTKFGDALVSLAAPGEGVITTYPGGGYAGTWGTSFSAPLVAGGAALLVQIDPSVNYQKANDQFGKAVAMMPGMGKGRLNLFEAVRTLPDVTAPAVNVLTPSGGGVVTGEVLLSASASDNVAVTGV
jgi:subtilisin family serine protease